MHMNTIVYDEDVMYFTQKYHECYSDSIEIFENASLITKDVIRLMQFLRDEFKKLAFDFHACFYYEAGSFHLHRSTYPFCQEDADKPGIRSWPVDPCVLIGI